MNTRSRIHRAGASLFCLMAIVVQTGCSQSPAGAPDYRLQHRVHAQEKVFSLILPLPDSGHLSTARHRRKIENFGRDFLRRGQGPFLVSRNDSGTVSEASRSMIAETLVAVGVPQQRLFFQARPDMKGGARSVELSYSGYVVRVPQCGDWSGQTGFDPTNLPHTDFGCSFQRNTGLMIANPADLSVASGGVQHDAQAGDRVIRTYREGRQLGTEFPVKEQKDFADVK